MRRTPGQFDDAAFRRMARVKQGGPPAMAALGPAMVSFFKQSVEKRQTKFGKVAKAWAQLVPETLAARCALDSFSRGTLTVLVDSSSHLYELKQLLLAGLQQQLLLACANAGLRKINLRSGRWYDGESPRLGKLRFD